MEINLKEYERNAVSDNITAAGNGYEIDCAAPGGDVFNFKNAALSCEERGDYAGAGGSKKASITNFCRNYRWPGIKPGRAK